MKLGVMNYPANDILDEIIWTGENHFDFFELTLEPVRSLPENIIAKKIIKLLKTYNLEIIGHTCYYLQFASPIKRVREAAIEELKSYIDVFSKLGVKMVNIHTDENYPSFFNKRELAKRNAEGLNKLATHAKPYGIQIMLEHNPNKLLGKPEDIKMILDQASEVGFHFDVGHGFIEMGNYIEEYLTAFKDKLCHVHVSDNEGKIDDHLPLGAGKINWKQIIKLLKKYNYDNTITLEVFSKDKIYKLIGRDLFKKWWDLY